MQVTDEMVQAACAAYRDNAKDGNSPTLNDIRAALEAAMAELWRPIEEYDETSGERVILGIERNGTIDEVHVGYFSWAVNDDEESLWWSEQADDEIYPTHYMPLPSPPSKEGE